MYFSIFIHKHVVTNVTNEKRLKFRAWHIYAIWLFGLSVFPVIFACTKLQSRPPKYQERVGWLSMSSSDCLVSVSIGPLSSVVPAMYGSTWTFPAPSTHWPPLK